VSAARTRGWLAAVAVTAGHDVFAWRLRSEAGRPAVRFTAALAVLGIARAAGVSWAELGLDRRETGSGLRAGALAGVCVSAAVLAGAALPATRPFLRDERTAPAAGRDLAAGLARITFATVPPEEIIYRSALLGLRLEDGSRATAVTWSSALFGLSHILPTLSTMSQTALHHHLARGTLRQALFVGGNVVVTGLAGAAFACLRLRSGSVLAPLIAHAALNDAALVAGRAAHRVAHEQAGGRGHASSRPVSRPDG
jgi:membrane protease YdiL (CAAX protease family)